MNRLHATLARPSPPGPRAGTPADGLRAGTAERRRVIVLGAGMAGLVAAYELLRLGHEPVVLEARQRIGGRIHTIRDFAPGLYAEAGAMRIPEVHHLTLGYCAHFGVPLRAGVAANPRALAHIGGHRSTLADAETELPTAGFPLARHEIGRSRDDMWREATEEIRALYQRSGLEALDTIAAKYDGYSIRSFLREQGWSEGAIERYAVLGFSESTLNTGVMQEFREVIGDAYENVHEVVGGMDRLPAAFYRPLKAHLRLGVEVLALEQDGRGVTVRARVGGERVTVEGDYAICTLPFSVLRGIATTPAFSHEKRRAVRQLHYDAATKIFFQVRHPFWQRTDGIRGGTTITDMPIRRLIYPAAPESDTDRAILLASYTWGQDALQWSALSPERRVERALRDVGRIHPEIVDEFEAGVSYAWYDDPYAQGAYALFEPEQHTVLRHGITRPEGRIHFAGEHCSRWPAWIEGAVESSMTAATEVHEAARSTVDR
jgi:monoamine oxidase